MDRYLRSVAYWAADHRLDWLAALIFRLVCPYPIERETSARSCVKAGHCGCDNDKRLRGDDL